MKLILLLGGLALGTALIGHPIAAVTVVLGGAGTWAVMRWGGAA